MTPERQELEQAIANIDKVVGGFTCDRQARNIVEQAWQLIVETARKAHPAKETEDAEAD